MYRVIILVWVSLCARPDASAAHVSEFGMKKKTTPLSKDGLYGLRSEVLIIIKCLVA